MLAIAVVQCLESAFSQIPKSVGENMSTILCTILFIGNLGFFLIFRPFGDSKI